MTDVVRFGEGRVIPAGPYMLIYFAVFSAFIVFTGGVAVRFYEWRLDVLTGSYLGRDDPRRRVSQSLVGDRSESPLATQIAGNS